MAKKTATGLILCSWFYAYGKKGPSNNSMGAMQRARPQTFRHVKTLPQFLEVEIPREISHRIMYINRLMELTEQCIKKYRKHHCLPEPIHQAACSILKALKEHRCVWRQETNIAHPLVNESNLSESAYMWFAGAQLCDLVYGLTAHNHGVDTDMFKLLRQVDKDTRRNLQSAHLVIFETPIMEYTMAQLDQAYLHLRTNWRKWSLIRQDRANSDVVALADLLDLRAGFLATHEGSPREYNLEHYVCKRKDFPLSADASEREREQWTKKSSDMFCGATERFITDMEVLDFMLRREMVFLNQYRHSEKVWNVGDTLDGNRALSRKMRQAQVSRRGQVPDLFHVINGPAWQVFRDTILHLAEHSQGRRDFGFFYQFICYRIMLPVGQQQAYENSQRTKVQFNKLVNMLMPSSSTQYAYEKLMQYEGENAIKECFARGEYLFHGASAPQCTERWDALMRRDPVQEAFFVYVFDKLVQPCGLPWKDVFFYDENKFCEKRFILDNLLYPKVVALANSWFVYHQRELWNCREVSTACFVWMYIVHFNYSDLVVVADQEYDLRHIVEPVMNSDMSHALYSRLNLRNSQAPEKQSTEADSFTSSDVLMSKRERSEGQKPAKSAQSQPAEAEERKRRREDKSTNHAQRETDQYRFYPELNPLLNLATIQKNLRKEHEYVVYDKHPPGEASSGMSMPHGDEIYLDHHLVSKCLYYYHTDTAVQACRQYQQSDITSAVLNLGLGSDLMYAMQINSVGGGTQVSAMGATRNMDSTGSVRKQLLDDAFRIVDLTWEEFIVQALDSINVTGLLVVQKVPHRFHKKEVLVVRSWENTRVSLMEYNGQTVYQAWDHQVAQPGSMGKKGKASLTDERLEHSFVFDNFGYNPKLLGGQAVLTSRMAVLMKDTFFLDFMRNSAVVSEVVNSNPVVVMERPYKVENTSEKLVPDVRRYADEEDMAEAAEIYENADELDQSRMNKSNRKQKDESVAPLVRNLKNDLDQTRMRSHRSAQIDFNPLMEEKVSTHTYQVMRDWTTSNSTPRAYPRSDLGDMEKLYQQKVCSIMAVPWDMVYGNQTSIKHDTRQMRSNYLRLLRTMLGMICRTYSYAVNALLHDRKLELRGQELRSLPETQVDPQRMERLRNQDFVHISMRIVNYDDEHLQTAYLNRMIDYETYTNSYLSLHSLIEYKDDVARDPLSQQDKRLILMNQRSVRGQESRGKASANDANSHGESSDDKKKEKDNE